VQADLVKLILDFAEKVSTTSRSKLEARLKDESAWKKFVSLVYAQDGDTTAWEKITGYAARPDHSPGTHKKERHDQEDRRASNRSRVSITRWQPPKGRRQNRFRGRHFRDQKKSVNISIVTNR
jgi:hypothetical protein